MKRGEREKDWEIDSGCSDLASSQTGGNDARLSHCLLESWSKMSEYVPIRCRGYQTDVQARDMTVLLLETPVAIDPTAGYYYRLQSSCLPSTSSSLSTTLKNDPRIHKEQAAEPLQSPRSGLRVPISSPVPIHALPFPFGYCSVIKTRGESSADGSGHVLDQPEVLGDQAKTLKIKKYTRQLRRCLARPKGRKTEKRDSFSLRQARDRREIPATLTTPSDVGPVSRSKVLQRL